MVGVWAMTHMTDAAYQIIPLAENERRDWTLILYPTPRWSWKERGIVYGPWDLQEGSTLRLHLDDRAIEAARGLDPTKNVTWESANMRVRWIGDGRLCILVDDDGVCDIEGRWTGDPPVDKNHSIEITRDDLIGAWYVEEVGGGQYNFRLDADGACTVSGSGIDGSYLGYWTYERDRDPIGGGLTGYRLRLYTTYACPIGSPCSDYSLPYPWLTGIDVAWVAGREGCQLCIDADRGSSPCGMLAELHVSDQFGVRLCSAEWSK